MTEKDTHSAQATSGLSRRLGQNLKSAPTIPLFIAGLASIPILAVLFSIFPFRPSLWAELWATTLPDYILNSILLMVLTGAIATVIGTGAAWCISMLNFPGRKTLSWLLILPLASPAYIISYVYVDLLEFYGPLQSGFRHIFGWGSGDYSFPPIRTLLGAALIMGLVLYPYVYLMARAAFSLQSASQWQVARSLGLSPRQAFWRVALPAARPGIVAGLALVLMETLADFGVADYFGIPTLSTGIFRNWLAGGDRDAAMKLAAIMLCFVFLLTSFEAWNRKGKAETLGKTAKQTSRLSLSKKAKWAVSILCAAPVILGFAIPILRLIYNAVTHADLQTKALFLTYAKNSVTIALIVSAAAVLIGLALAYSQRKTNSKLTNFAIRLSTFGYALPGALLAVGLLAPIGELDQTLTRFAKNHFNWSGGLLLSGTTALLIYALTVRFLTVSFNALDSGFDKIPKSMDAAARSLGANPVSLIRRVHIPLLSQSLLVAATLVFIDVLRELPATLILRPFNFDTLATRIYWLASDERLAEASTAALAIILLGLIPVIFLNRKMHD